MMLKQLKSSLSIW